MRRAAAFCGDGLAFGTDTLHRHAASSTLVAESDSEHSLSGFETVASHSFEEDEEEEQDKERRVRPTGGHRFPAGMSREDEEVPSELQANGIGRHR